MAMHARELFLRTVQTGSFRGNWNKKGAIEETKKMEPDLKSLLYCYLEGDTLANCEDVDKLEEKAHRIIDFLGGEDWAHKFMNGAPKDEREKTEENIAKVRFFLDTILDNVTMDMDIVASETFGPIAPIIRVDGLDEAINEANNTQYGLQAGVFTESIHSALRCANEIDAGSVLINKESTFRTDAMPFGGFKSSGMGKEGIKYAVEDMCKTKLIAFNCR